MLSMGQYIQDYDEKYPPVSAANPTFGWAATTQPYLQSPLVFQCPSEENAPASTPPDASQPSYTDYWFNARAAGKYGFELKDATRTITLGDGNNGTDATNATNAAYHLLSIPARWRKEEKSPLYRHLDGANYAFADGHVKWFNASKWKNGLDFSSSGEPTLRLKPTN